MGDCHVYVVAAGFGLRVIPKAPPYRYALSPTAPQLDVHRLEGQKWLFARLIPDGGGYKSKLTPETPSLADVLDVVPGPDADRWWLQTTVFRVPLPAGWTAASIDGKFLFELVSADGALIFVQTPRRRPPLAEMCAPDQSVASTGADARSEWVDLEYVHEGAPWRQRHRVLTLDGVNVIITAQAPAGAMLGALATQAELIDNVHVAPTRPAPERGPGRGPLRLVGDLARRLLK